MKTIMFAMAVGLIAIGVQANSVKWSVTSTANSANYATSADLADYTAYLIQAGDWTGKAADLKNATASTEWVTAKDTGTARQYKTATPVTSETTLDTGDYNFYVVLSDGTHYWASEAKVGTVYELGSTDPNNKTVGIALSGADAIKAASIQTHTDAGTGGVPEPTSGLLLLVGGAMLALRRKQK